ncbi:hypothetical protein BJX62DRAFT_239418 [Aspergillus germanicus]
MKTSPLVGVFAALCLDSAIAQTMFAIPTIVLPTGMSTGILTGLPSMSTWLAPSIVLPTNGLPISLSIPSWPTAYIPTTLTNDAPIAPTVQTSPTGSVGDSTKAVSGAFERIHARQIVPFYG